MYQNVKLLVVFASSNIIRSAFRFKNPLSKSFNLNMIYKYKCNIGNDVYISETKGNFFVRYSVMKRTLLQLENIVNTNIM